MPPNRARALILALLLTGACSEADEATSSDGPSTSTGGSSTGSATGTGGAGTGGAGTGGSAAAGAAGQSCLDGTELDTLSVTGDESDLTEGTHAETDPTTFANQATQSCHPELRGGFGASTRCGLDGDIIRVTTLEDDADSIVPGSLREALQASGPRIVVFEVSGAILLESQLAVTDPYVTIAGQTAPPPGISLYHEQFRIQTHDVCVQHVRMRPGDRHADGSAVTATEAGDRHTLLVSASGGGGHHIVLDNVSLSWSHDETIALLAGVADVTVRDSIIAEPLHDSVHDTAGHSYCFLGAEANRVAVLGNVIAHCRRRYPRADGGAWMMVNNVMYNPGDYVIHGHLPADYTVVGNVLDFPSDPAAWVNGGAEALVSNRHDDIHAYFLDNLIPSARVLHEFRGPATVPLTVEPVPRVWVGDVTAVTGASVEPDLVDHVGAFPRYRDEVDTRVIDDLAARAGGYVDSQDDVGGYPAVAANNRALTPPSNLRGDDDGDGVENVVEWLQSFVDAIE
ncbi:MAG: hypothetical protein JRI23_10060 [Deltaproteobacteria bacterium]|jgi:hypothetical protein|nr:hypothetical protein [Deltaproteobacteria bacterium]MBW2532016.1 hypothetical protein [Deltaproteobacteria bacterium]